ncbi:MAG: enterobactin exporter EntS [Bacteroidetes bacterium ADurb.Bin139]|jgi:MFS transporter, DHA3 family, macrolide efflux protein|nr:MAG: enterobactin exporter EntS [Bacteroidetes bacterium ADurb.Bin139]HOZ19728.1 MFS transporter [Bacteroidales bacterium]
MDPGGTTSKKIALFLLSQNISLFGSSVVGFAIIWHITLETSSGMWLTLSTICAMFPQVIISLWGGVWADRHNRKTLIMLTDGFIALSTFGLAIAFWAGFQRLELLLAVSVVRSIGAGIQTPAVHAIFPQLVPREKLTRIQGINHTLGSVLLLLSPAVGGVLLGSVNIAWAFMLDVFTAILAIVVMLFIKVDTIERTEKKASVFAELRDGVVYAFNNPLLKRLIICYAFSFFLFTPAAVLTPLLVERSYGNDVWLLTANEIVWSAGAIVGGIFVSLYGDFKSKVRAIAISLGAFGITFALMGVAGKFIIYLIFMGVAGFFMPIIATSETVLIQVITEPSKMGRVFSIIQIVAASSMPLAILLFGPMADVISVEVILVFTGILLLLTGIIFYLSSRKLIFS